MRGSRPRMRDVRSGGFACFSCFQDTRRHAAAGEFADRPRRAGVILLATRLRRLGRKLVIAALVLLAIVGFSPLGNLLLYSLESRFPPWDAARGAPDGIIVLGGSIDPDISAAHGTACSGTPSIASSPQRRWPTDTRRRVSSSPAAAPIWSPTTPRRPIRRRDVRKPRRLQIRLTIERQSRNTLENAEFSKALVYRSRASAGFW